MPRNRTGWLGRINRDFFFIIYFMTFFPKINYEKSSVKCHAVFSLVCYICMPWNNCVCNHQGEGGSRGSDAEAARWEETTQLAHVHNWGSCPVHVTYQNLCAPLRGWRLSLWSWRPKLMLPRVSRPWQWAWLRGSLAFVRVFLDSCRPFILPSTSSAFGLYSDLETTVFPEIRSGDKNTVHI